MVNNLGQDLSMPHIHKFHMLGVISLKECGRAVLKPMYGGISMDYPLSVAMKIFCQIEFEFYIHFVPL